MAIFKLKGTEGRDRYVINVSTQVILSSQEGDDIVTVSRKVGHAIDLGDGDDTLFDTNGNAVGAVNVVNGGRGDDVFEFATTGSQFLGDQGRDTFRISLFDSFSTGIDGGRGDDTLDLSLLGPVGGMPLATEINLFDQSVKLSREGLPYNFRSIESVVGTRFGDSIFANAANVSLRGAGGVDTVVGSVGDDDLFGDTDSDTLIGGPGNDRLHGGSDSDILDGAAGADTIVGGAGDDRLTGGDGADTFLFTALDQADPTLGVLDFARAGGDRLDFSEIDADEDRRGDQGFRFIGEAAFSGNGREIRIEGETVLVSVASAGADETAAFRVSIIEGGLLERGDFIL
jgi:serralysin